MVASLVLLPSPLLGPSVWQPAARALTAYGWTTKVCAPPAGPTNAHEVLDAFVSGLPPVGELLLIAHSHAGAFIPAITSRHPSVTGLVFVDAVLPPRTGQIPLAPPEFLDFLRARADATGLLPVWTQWWEEDEVAALFPDAQTRQQVESEQTRLPLSYFKDRLPVPDGWDERPAAYLAFGDTYSREREDAERRHWPVTTMAGGHLHLLAEPTQVVATLIDLMERLGLRASAR